MQTFMPYSGFGLSVKCLDYKRLGKQRVEARQILNVLSPDYNKKGWRNHPAVLMWRGYEESLKLYYDLCVDEWIDRGYNNTMVKIDVDTNNLELPPWLWDERFIVSHRSNLLRKDFAFYNKYEWDVDTDLPYFWPTKEGY